MLMVASQAGHYELVKTLLDRGATNGIDIQDKCGWSALMFAAFTGSSVDVVSLLLEHNADVHLANSDGRTALFMASEKVHVEIVKLLLENGASIRHKDTWGKPAIALGTYSQHSCHPDLVDAFLQYCDNYMEDVYSALWAAVKHCCPLSTAILIKSGAVIYGVDQLLVLNDERTADPKCVNCSCLAVKAQL